MPGFLGRSLATVLKLVRLSTVLCLCFTKAPDGNFCACIGRNLGIRRGGADRIATDLKYPLAKGLIGIQCSVRRLNQVQDI